jgi:hypothetical protein
MNPKSTLGITGPANVLTMAEEDLVKATFNTRLRCKDVANLAPRDIRIRSVVDQFIPCLATDQFAFWQ